LLTHVLTPFSKVLKLLFTKEGIIHIFRGEKEKEEKQSRINEQSLLPNKQKAISRKQKKNLTHFTK